MTDAKNWVIDANIILRALLNDIPEQARRVEGMLKRAAAGELAICVPEPVISDVVYVLSGMKVPKIDIADAVRSWLNLPNVTSLGIDSDVIHTSLDLFLEKNIKWSDALIAARMLEWGYSEICTFDHHFNRIPGITKVEP